MWTLPSSTETLPWLALALEPCPRWGSANQGPRARSRLCLASSCLALDPRTVLHFDEVVKGRRRTCNREHRACRAANTLSGPAWETRAPQVWTPLPGHLLAVAGGPSLPPPLLAHCLPLRGTSFHPGMMGTLVSNGSSGNWSEIPISLVSLSSGDTRSYSHCVPSPRFPPRCPLRCCAVLLSPHLLPFAPVLSCTRALTPAICLL